MDLPTYTSIWRIEKRLYKLYDFRLPMPLPIGQVTIFVAIAVPYVVLLTLVGVPFNHTLVWLYILPPGAATWLVTRPVLESKRLPELVKSQLRYLAEPRILCRMVPLAEPEVVVVIGKIWRPRAARRPAGQPEPAARAERAARPEQAEHAEQAEQAAHAAPARDAPAGTPAQPPAEVLAAAARVARPGVPPAWSASRPDAWSPARPPSSVRQAASAAGPPAGRVRSAPPAIWPSAPARARGAGATWPTTGLAPGRGARPVNQAEMKLVAAGRPAEPQLSRRSAEPGEPSPEAPAPAVAEPSALSEPAAPGPPASPVQPRPVITVVGADRARSAPPAVERALAGPSARRADLRDGPVSIVPGGHRPGKPDLLQRDRTRVQLPIDFSAKIIVLGCTVGAGQTMTALVVGEVLASLRADRVAVLDLNPGGASVTRRAQARPALSQAALARSSRLTVIGHPPEPGDATSETAGAAAPAGAASDPAADAVRFEAASREYDLVVADPGAAAMPRLLAVADQLIMVAPASAAAPGAISMTFEWLDAHGQHDLAAGSIMVMNGVSRRSITHVEQAERVCVGRCRAIVRVPWDDQLQKRAAKRTAPPTPGAHAGQQWAGVLNPATAGAYTALAGVLVASLHDRAKDDEHRGKGVEQSREPAGQAQR